MWPLLFPAIGAGASLFGAIDQATQTRAIREKLDDIINYLRKLDEKIAEIEMTQRQILALLNELPTIVRSIVREEVALSELDSRYSTLHSIELDIITLKHDKYYRITEPGWHSLSDALTYVFLHENRISYLFRIIGICEMTLAVTRNQAQPFVRQLLVDKIELVAKLREDYRVRIEVQLTTIKAYLDNTDYIVSHNLDQIDNFSLLAYVACPDRNRTVNYTEQECHSRHGHCPGDDYEVCKTVQRTREELDTSFISARNNHVALIEQLKPVIQAMLDKFGYLSEILYVLEKYLATITRNKSALNEVIMLFPASETNFANRDTEVLNDEETKAYDYYFAGIPALEAPKFVGAENIEVRGVFASVNFICPPV